MTQPKLLNIRHYVERNDTFAFIVELFHDAGFVSFHGSESQFIPAGRLAAMSDLAILEEICINADCELLHCLYSETARLCRQIVAARVLKSGDVPAPMLAKAPHSLFDSSERLQDTPYRSATESEVQRALDLIRNLEGDHP